LTLVLVVVLGLIFAPPLSGQTAGELPEGAAVERKYFDFFVVKGGPIAYGLILLSVVTVALTVEYSLAIRRKTIVPEESAGQAQALIDDKKYLDAIEFTANDPTMMGYVLNAGLLEASNGYEAMERALQESLEERSARMFRKIEYLNIIGNVAPMIGLFGTVVGMILLFSEIHAADAFPAARDVAERVAVALITTFWGLAVAIPALSIYAMFRNRIDVLTAECALTTERMVAVFKPGASRARESVT
jgi:biopolymer transport protein ExbB